MKSFCCVPDRASATFLLLIHAHHAEMQCVRPKFSAGRATSRSRISNRSRLLPGVDGRSATARRFRDICAAYESEAGGNVTEVERDLIRQAAGLTLRAEQLQGAIVRGEAVDNDELIRLSSTAKRLLEAIRAKAAKNKPTGAAALQEYVARKAAEKAASALDGDAA
jgi:hypothetical protein